MAHAGAIVLMVILVQGGTRRAVRHMQQQRGQTEQRNQQDGQASRGSHTVDKY